MFQKENLHHAYFIAGERRAVLLDLEKFLKDAFSIVRSGHPDVHYAEHESFGIDEGRALQDMQIMRPVLGDRKIFILHVGSMTSEAQNSLLKVFEEPTPGTHFFVISSSPRILLPTLRSRMVVVFHPSATDNSSEVMAKRFATLSPKERLATVAPLIEEKDKARAEDFLQSLVAELSRGGMEKAGKGRARAIKELLSLISYLKDRSPSLKLILERAALFDF
jgi:DNA polymerase III delta prime subunit